MLQVVLLVEKIAIHLREDFKAYVPRILPLLLSSLTPQRSSQAPSTVVSVAITGGQLHWDQKLELVLRCLMTLHPVLHEYMHIVIPALIKLVDQLSDMGPEGYHWQGRTIRALAHLYRHGCAQMSLQSLASRIIHLCCRILDKDGGTSPDIRDAVMETICNVATQLGPQFMIFAPLVGQVVSTRGITHARYQSVVIHLQESLDHSSTSITQLDTTSQDGDLGFHVDLQGLPEEEIIAEYLGLHPGEETGAEGPGGEHGLNAGVQRLHVNQQNLQKAWDVSQRSTTEDWGDWIRRFSLELLRESPSPALRSCSALAQVCRARKGALCSSLQIREISTCI